MIRAWAAAAVLGAMLMVAHPAAAQTPTGECVDADSCKIGSDRPASLLVFPKVVVDPAAGVDTVIHLVNVSGGPVGVRCSYLNANGHCSNSGEVCTSSTECGGGQCVLGWVETDFRITLTQFQPIAWNASQGASNLPCDLFSSQPCQQRNDGRIPPVAETPFIGELKCVQVDDSDAPVDFNELTGEATIIRAPGSALDVSKYDAIGIQAIPGANNHDNHLCLGGLVSSDTCPDGAEYAGCPATVIVDHLFDGAEPGNTPPVTNRLTLVPCSENLLDPQSGGTPSVTVQVLVFNEFEQRTSTSFRVRCLFDRQLSDIDTGPGSADNGTSIFSVTAQATLAGQTRLTAVGGSQLANGVIGILEESRPCSDGPEGVCTATVNLHQQGRRTLSDVLELP